MTNAGSVPPLPPFQVLLDEHGGTVLRFLVRRLPAGDAEDCFQETWLAALRAYPRLRDATNLRAWILAIARSKLVDAQRAAARRPLPVAEIAEHATVEAPADAHTEIWDEVRALPAKQRSAVELRFASDQPYTSIARHMGTSEEAARRNVHEGISKLRRSRT